MLFIHSPAEGRLLGVCRASIGHLLGNLIMESLCPQPAEELSYVTATSTTTATAAAATHRSFLLALSSLEVLANNVWHRGSQAAGDHR